MGKQLKYFIPLMHEFEYKFVEKYLNKDDVLLEWGSGNGTIYFSSLVKKLISLEHDVDYFNQIVKTIELFNIKNIEIYHISGVKVKNQKLERHIAFHDYINFPIVNNIKFDKVLIDGRARKYCAIALSEYIDDETLVFIHDFNHDNVEGYEDENYFDDILNKYYIFDRVTDGRGIVALKKKKNGFDNNIHKLEKEE